MAVMAMVFALVTFAAQAQAKPNPKYASIVVEADSGQVVSERYADKVLYPASLTKMMTLYLMFDKIKAGEWGFNTRLYVSQNAANQVPSKLGLKRGDRITVKDAIKALIIKSANDVAVTVAENYAGSETRFATIMTNKARDLGMSRTVFRNASGLPNRKQVSTARDMAVLSIALMKDHEEFYHYFDNKSFRYKGRRYRGHNRLLSTYRGMDGLKTGYIRAAGFNLASSATRNNVRLVGVVFGGRTSQSRNRHMAALLDRGFKTVRSGTYLASAKLGVPPVPTAKPNPDLEIAALDTTIDVGADEVFDVTVEMLEQGSAADIVEAKPVASKGVDLDMVPVPAKKQLAYYDPKKDRMVTSFVPKTNAIYGEWSIQVGAFKSRVQSDLAISHAQKKVPLLAAAMATNVPVKGRRGKYLFRARLTGLDKNGAYAACSVLKDCLVIAPRS